MGLKTPFIHATNCTFGISSQCCLLITDFNEYVFKTNDRQKKTWEKEKMLVISIVLPFPMIFKKTFFLKELDVTV